MPAAPNVAADLLAYLRAAWDAPDAVYLEPPVRFATGVENRVYGLRLGGVDERHAQPLVAKVYGSHVAPERVRFEAIVQEILVDLGYPAPRVVATCEDAGPLGAPFAIMERLPGAPMLDALTRLSPPIAEVMRSLPEVLFRMPRVLAEMQARLHALDPAPLLRALAAAGIPDTAATFGGHLTAIEERIERAGLDGLAVGIRWLKEHGPPEPGRLAICHGDFWFGNVIQQGGVAAGVIDWAMGMVAIADAAYDVGITHTLLLRGAGDFAGPLRGVARFAQRRIASRYLDVYRRIATVNPEAVRYYGVMRCVDALSWVGERRAGVVGALRSGDAPDLWDVSGSTDGYVAHFSEATGIDLRLPPSRSSDP